MKKVVARYNADFNMIVNFADTKTIAKVCLRKVRSEQMIEVEGYKAFHGVMRITPKNKQFPAFTLECDWLYKPEYHCWYGDGRSFPAGICEVVSE